MCTQREAKNRIPILFNLIWIHKVKVNPDPDLFYNPYTDPQICLSDIWMNRPLSNVRYGVK